MRENIGMFKAKRVDNNRWIEGSYVHYSDYKGRDNYLIYARNGNPNTIDPETICQFTGLLDKHGNKIWENDILSAYGSYDLTVVWDNENARFWAEFIGTKSGHEDDDNDDYAEACDFKYYEATGNRFD